MSSVCILLEATVVAHPVAELVTPDWAEALTGVAVSYTHLTLPTKA